MKKRLVLLVMIAVLLCGALCGCGSSVPEYPITDGVGFEVDSVYSKYGGEMYTADKPLDDIPYTVEAWIYMPEGETANSVIFGNYDSHTKYSLSFAIKNGNPRVYWADGLENAYDLTFEDIDVRCGRFVHVAFVNDTAKNRMLCYIDGKLSGEKIAPDYDRSVILPPFGVGGDNRPLNTMYFRGRIKSVTAFSVARSAKQIASDMKKAPTDGKNVLASYDMESVSQGGTVFDNSANAVHLTYSKMWVTEEVMSLLRSGNTERAFSLAVIGDTQYMSRYNPDKLPIMYNWIADNVQEKKIAYSIGLGDITDQDIKEEWDNAKKGISILDGKLEYILSRGNHDVKKGGDLFNDYFAKDEKYYAQFETHGGVYEQGSVANCYRLLDVEGAKLLIMNLDYSPDSDVLSWASGIIEKYPERKVIISTHAYLHSDGNRLAIGERIWKELASRYQNVQLVLCGHISDNQVSYVHRKGENGNIVTEMLIDAQDYDKKLGGLGMVAMLYFNSDASAFDVEYYSTVLDRYYLSENCFSLTLPEAQESYQSKVFSYSKIKPQGEGTKESPYLISEAGNLIWMEASVKEKTGTASFAGTYFKQTSDIDLEGHSIYPIGSYYYASDFDMKAFGGEYDGAGYSIKNGIIRADTTESAWNKEQGYGLFGVIYGGCVKNVTLDNITVVSSGVGGMIVGKAAGNSSGTSDESFNRIENCRATKNCKLLQYVPTNMSVPESITLDESDCAGILGGIVGSARSATVIGCKSAMTIEASGSFFVAGGIAGAAGYNSVITDCRFTGKIKKIGESAGDDFVTGDIYALESPTDITYDTADNVMGTLTVK